MSKRNFAEDILMGLATGDALGVPYEFRSRAAIRLNPAKGMIGNGTHLQPAGTWSDDSSLAFCLAEALTQPFDLQIAAQNFIKWYRQSYWTAYGEVFDIGITTRQAITEMEMGVRAELAGGYSENSNGNGSLMRILPLALFLTNKPVDERFEWTKKVSSMTHAHIRSVIACFYYLEYALLLMQGLDKITAYRQLQQTIPGLLQNMQLEPAEIALYNRLLTMDISALQDEHIKSSGYVLHTLEASIWCLLTTNNYADAVLAAVNMGDDTDTTACVTGGLAALVYGAHTIPHEWLQLLARKNDILELANRINQYKP